MSGHLAVLSRVDQLYEGVVMTPRDWTDEILEGWAVEITAEMSQPSKSLMRELRRCLRMARKMRDFWIDPPKIVPSDAGDWRTRVDVVLGVRAWRPVLEIARDGLSTAPTEAIFEETRRRFREVHGDCWMEGFSYADWETEEVADS